MCKNNILLVDKVALLEKILKKVPLFYWLFFYIESLIAYRNKRTKCNHQLRNHAQIKALQVIIWWDSKVTVGILWNSLSALYMHILEDVPRNLKKNKKKSKKSLDILIR